MLAASAIRSTHGRVPSACRLGSAMHPAARPGGLSFASNGEKLRAISHSVSFASRSASPLWDSYSAIRSKKSRK